MEKNTKIDNYIVQERLIELIGDIPHSINPDVNMVKNIFNNENEYEIEIGSGHGHFLIRRSLAVKNRNVVGFEWSQKWYKKIRDRLLKHKIGNGVVFHFDIRDVIEQMFDPNSLHAVYMNFPDPWWKKRHRKRRVLTNSFINILNKIMVDDGLFFFQSDVKELAETYLELMDASEYFVNIAGSGSLLKENIMGIRSLREEKSIERGLDIYRFGFKKSRV